MTTLRSALDKSGLRWPAVPSVRGAQLMALLYQFEQSEHWSADAVLQAQQSQMEPLLQHARRHSAFYAQRLSQFDHLPVVGSDMWRQIPPLTRTDLLTHARDIVGKGAPRSHGKTHVTRTSGSTGQTVAVRKTEITRLIWQALALREHLWLGRDASLASAIIRAHGAAAPGPDGKHVKGWGVPFDTVWKCGLTHLLDLATDVAVQATWLAKHRPSYLLTYPTNLAALLDADALRDLNVTQVLCVGETVTDSLRQRARERWNAEVVANYSSQELGYIGVHCRHCGQYHIQSESVYVEVLDEHGEHCRSGEVGRVVVTDLHNFAMPLIRYELGDHAEVGEPCAARPGMPSIRNVLGRTRNMLLFPDGRKHWPLVGFKQFNDIAPIKQYQFVQRTRDEIEVRLVADDELSKSQIGQLAKVIRQAMGHPFKLHFRQTKQPLPKTKSGKFEEFVCLAN
jgi:phenylacetate-CoA ligase